MICGPRLSPIVAQVLESDPNLQFAQDEDGWHIIDNESGIVHRSPIDDGGDSDVAYIARLRRPDGKGTFLYMAGIHAAGTAGAAHFIEHNLAEIYSDVKTRRFSTLISAQVSDDLKV